MERVPPQGGNILLLWNAGQLAVKGQLLLGLVTLQNTASTRFCNMYCNHFHSSPQRDLVEQYDGDNEDDPLFTAL